MLGSGAEKSHSDSKLETECGGRVYTWKSRLAWVREPKLDERCAHTEVGLKETLEPKYSVENPGSMVGAYMSGKRWNKG